MRKYTSDYKICVMCCHYHNFIVKPRVNKMVKENQKKKKKNPYHLSKVGGRGMQTCNKDTLHCNSITYICLFCETRQDMFDVSY